MTEPPCLQFCDRAQSWRLRPYRWPLPVIPLLRREREKCVTTELCEAELYLIVGGRTEGELEMKVIPPPKDRA
jgi:hypothetical protein